MVREGRVLAEGWHREYGGRHAEIMCLEQAGEGARGATVYVSLEPCNHHGKTPPCTEALLEAGIARLVYAAPDPGQVSGGGAEALRKKGVEVTGPVLLPQEFQKENPAFFFNQVRGKTYLALKLAHTLDGRISERAGLRTSITGPEAHRETHRLRAGFDAILVGSETALVDDPLLTVREPVAIRQPPARIVLDTRGRLRPQARLFQDVPDIPLLVFTGEDASELVIQDLEAAGARVHPVPLDGDMVSLDTVLETCWEVGIRSVLCEGGGRLAGSLMSGGFAHRMYLFVAPFVLGEEGVPAFPDGPDRAVWDLWSQAFPPMALGRDVLLTLDRTI